MAFKLKEDIKLRGLLVKGEISGFTHHRSLLFHPQGQGVVRKGGHVQQLCFPNELYAPERHERHSYGQLTGVRA